MKERKKEKWEALRLSITHTKAPTRKHKQAKVHRTFSSYLPPMTGRQDQEPTQVKLANTLFVRGTLPLKRVCCAVEEKAASFKHLNETHSHQNGKGHNSKTHPDIHSDQDPNGLADISDS